MLGPAEGLGGDVLTLLWNLKEESMAQMACLLEQGGRFVVPIPELQVFPAQALPAPHQRPQSIERYQRLRGEFFLP